MPPRRNSPKSTPYLEQSVTLSASCRMPSSVRPYRGSIEAQEGRHGYQAPVLIRHYFDIRPIASFRPADRTRRPSKRPRSPPPGQPRILRLGLVLECPLRFRIGSSSLIVADLCEVAPRWPSICPTGHFVCIIVGERGRSGREC